MEFYRCETCGYLLIHDGQFREHCGHRLRNAAHSTLAEDVKIIGWKIQRAGEEKCRTIRRLFGY